MPHSAGVAGQASAPGFSDDPPRTQRVVARRFSGRPLHQLDLRCPAHPGRQRHTGGEHDAGRDAFCSVSQRSGGPDPAGMAGYGHCNQRSRHARGR